MISFIVIGRNEGWKLELCLKSIHKAIKENQYINSEIIYIDSNSSDNSVQLAKTLQPVKIFRLTKDFNAAIARNLGARQSKGEILFFIDGDMEIESSFLGHIINQNGELIYPFLNGFYYDYFYDDNWKFLYKKQNPSPEKIKHDYFETVTGGLFIISKELWKEIGGMKEYLSRGEDPDLALRLAKKGYSKLRKNKLMAIHHTKKEKHVISFKKLTNKVFISGRILPYRENLFLPATIRRLVRHEYMALALLFSLILIPLNIYLFYIFAGLYLIGNLLRAYRRFRSFKKLPAILLKDFIFLIGFFFYWPRKKTMAIEYIEC